MTISVTSVYIYKQRAAPMKDLITSIIIIIIAGITLFPVLGLTVFHIGLVAMGRTTNEQVTGKFGGGHNPFNLGCYRNCCNVLFGPLPPRYLGYKAPKRKKPKNKDQMSPTHVPDYHNGDHLPTHPLNSVNTEHVQIEMEPMKSTSPKPAMRGGGWVGGLQMTTDGGLQVSARADGASSSGTQQDRSNHSNGAPQVNSDRASNNSKSQNTRQMRVISGYEISV